MKHISVLTKEVLEGLAVKSGEDFIDCTVGDGGHSQNILKLSEPDGKIFAIDLDPVSLAAARKKIGPAGDRVRFIQGNFKDLKSIAENENITEIDGVLFDLGYSSRQMDEPNRGFSFSSVDLDMRYNQSLGGLTASDIVNDWPVGELIRIFKEYGEERLAGPIAKEIVSQRSEEKLDSESLRQLIADIYKRRFRRHSRLDPATKVFMALRIAVNDELKALEGGLEAAIDLLAPGGRIAVISFHSLEDRIVKHKFREEARDCVCGPEAPVCVCNHKPKLKIVTRKPIVATPKEIKENQRSRSAKLRVATKL
ncbi:16S rRNA (cytosine(1402)-N(4))-methyltransferase [bacterium]|nr:16S rRNA (cytosine(1402)-N(4))-methyltransferase [bacterium]